jgi:phage repressor protein C with HTH and peptisase S24 domain
MDNIHGRTIRMMRERRGWTQQQLAGVLELDKSAVSRMEDGKRRVKAHELERLAEAFGVEVDEIVRAQVGSTMRRTVGGSGIPVINQAPAGNVVNYEEYGVDSGQGFHYIDSLGITDSLAFAVIVVGDSMEPKIHEGDYLVFSPLDPEEPRPDQADLKPGSVVYVRFSVESDHDGCTIARYFPEDDGRIRLQKDNPKYRPIVCQREDIRQLAVGLQRREML